MLGEAKPLRPGAHPRDAEAPGTTTPPQTPPSPTSYTSAASPRSVGNGSSSSPHTPAIAGRADTRSTTVAPALPRFRRPPSHCVRALIAITRAHKGERDCSWQRFPLPLWEYNELRHALAERGLEEWVEDKLRYDYDPSAGELCLRMPTPLHDVFSLELQLLLWKKLEDLDKGSLSDHDSEAVRRLVGSLSMGSTSDVYKEPVTQGKRSPDASFYAKGFRYPPLVIEMAHSQKSADLPSLARRWISHTAGATKTVIAIDTEYRDPKQRQEDATSRSTAFTVYRYVKEQRNGDGKIVGRAKAVQEDVVLEAGDSSHPLLLSLFDFLPRDMYSKSKDPDPAIAVSHDELLAILAVAEARQKASEQPPEPSPKKRARDSRSPSADTFATDDSPRLAKHARLEEHDDEGLEFVDDGARERSSSFEYRGTAQPGADYSLRSRPRRSLSPG